MDTLISSGHAPVNGLEMYFEVHGSGDIPLVLIHGGGSTIETSFGKLLPVLAKKNQVIALELQAHGRTSDRDADETFDQDAQDVVTLLAYLGIAKANFLGFSNGGTTTLLIGANHSSVVNKLVVISGATKREGFIQGFFEGMVHASLDHMPQPLKDAFLNLGRGEDALQVMFEKDKNRMIHFEDITDSTTASISAPTMFMVSDQDVITVEHTRGMAKLVNGSRLVVLPGVHGAFIGEICTGKVGSQMPEATAIIVQEFLES